ncbi:MAG: glycosyltransferase family 4 protein [Thermoanaerobaculia bacterium]
MPATSLRILFLTQTWPRFAGDTSGPFIRDLARALVADGDTVHILAPHTAGLARTWEDDGVTVHTFRYAPERLEVLGYSRSLEADERIRPLAGLVAPAYLWAARRAAYRLLSRVGFDLLQAHWVVPNALAAAPLGLRVPLAVGLHGSDVFQAERRGVRRWVAHALRRTRLLTGCSPELVDRVCALGFDRVRAHVIPYGVDVEVFRPGAPRVRDWRRDLRIPPAAPLLLTVGRMVSKKGFDVLIEVLPGLLERHAELHVVLAGAGDLLDGFRQRLARWPDRAHLPGAVLRDTLPDLYRAADLFVLPAVHDRKGNVDGLPNVILEAMASGLPVVASGISGIPLAVEDGIHGLLVPERDPAALASALDTLLGNAEARRETGQAARRRAETELTWKAIASRYRHAYEDALGGAVS